MFYFSSHAVKQLVRYAAQMGQKRIEIIFVTKNIFCTTLIHLDVIYCTLSACLFLPAVLTNFLKTITSKLRNEQCSSL